MSDNQLEPACVACHGALAFFGGREGYEYHRCTACGTLQLVPLPLRADLDRAYATEYATANHVNPDPAKCLALASTYSGAALRVLKDHGATEKVAEVGAGWGRFGQLVTNAGYSYTGVEPSEKMAAHCRSMGLSVVEGGIADFPDSGYSALVMTNVFEHLVDHEHWLEKANRLLSDDNALFVSSQPTARFATLAAQLLRLGRVDAPLPRIHQEFCPPWHTVLFSCQGMKMLVERHGFELLEIRIAPPGRESGIMGRVQWTLEHVNKFGGRIMGERWPLAICHLFVFKKLPTPPLAEKASMPTS